MYDALSEDKKGIFAMVYASEMDNMFLSIYDTDLDIYGELLIYVDENEYLESKDTEIENEPLKSLLTGKDDKSVKVWQDSDEVVHSETENTADTNYTTHTPSF